MQKHIERTTERKRECVYYVFAVAKSKQKYQKVNQKKKKNDNIIRKASDPFVNVRRAITQKPPTIAISSKSQYE